jgi:hypothetical protein
MEQAACCVWELPLIVGGGRVRSKHETTHMLRFAIYEAEVEVIMIRFKRGSVTKHTP